MKGCGKMCRLAFVRGYSSEKDRAYLTRMFTNLEHAGGGSGNGIGGWIGGKPFITKGVDLKIEEIVNIAIEKKWDNDSFIFHTRIPSKGPKTDENCHPFRFGDTMSCHNGTTTSSLAPFTVDLIEHIAKRGDNVTDSECVALLINKYGYDALFNKTLSLDFRSVFMTLYKDGKLKVYKSGDYCDLDIFMGNGHSVILASEFPGSDYTLKNDFREVPNGMPIEVNDLLDEKVWALLKPATVPYVWKADDRSTGQKNQYLLPTTTKKNTSVDDVDGITNKDYNLYNDLYVEKLGTNEEPNSADILVLKCLQASMPELVRVVSKIAMKDTTMVV